jgi:hypothetical protein
MIDEELRRQAHRSPGTPFPKHRQRALDFGISRSDADVINVARGVDAKSTAKRPCCASFRTVIDRGPVFAVTA